MPHADSLDTPQEAATTTVEYTTTQRALAALAIGSCALTAGSIFCFPLFAPNLTRDLGLSLTQTNTIWAGAVLGEYVAAAPWGLLADAKGPRYLCAAAAVLFGAGYALMAGVDREALRIGASSSAGVLVTAYFLLVGTGVAASFFASLTAAITYFPAHPSLALSLPSTLFSLSSLFLTQVAALPVFTNRETGDLDAAKFLAFLGGLLALVNVFGAIVLSAGGRGSKAGASQESEPSIDEAINSETQPLLASSAQQQQLPLTGSGPSAKAYVRSPAFALLFLVLFASAGGAEMVMSSVGSMVVSLLAVHTDAAADPEIGRGELKVRARLVGLLATTNTVSRLCAGLLADVLNPSRPLSALATTTPAPDASVWTRVAHKTSRVRVSRITMLAFAQATLLGAFTYAATGLHSTSGLAVVCALTGIGYGCVFTLVPSVLFQAWGSRRFGRNWGILTYAAALGSLGFSLLFAAISDAVAEADTPLLALLNTKNGAQQHAVGGKLCLQGARCFKASFALAAVAGAASLAALWPLWRAWRTQL